MAGCCTDCSMGQERIAVWGCANMPVIPAGSVVPMHRPPLIRGTGRDAEWREWVPPEEAVAWIMGHVRRTSDLRGSLDQDDADRLLRGKAADGLVRLRGARLERSGKLWDEPEDATVIPAEKVEALRFVQSPIIGDTSLALTSVATVLTMRRLGVFGIDLFPAVFWISVRVSMSDLERVFLRETGTASEQGTLGRSSRSGPRAAIRAALPKIDGWTTMPRERLHRAVEKQLGYSVSLDTVKRARKEALSAG
jgi:hypothetical protein